MSLQTSHCQRRTRLDGIIIFFVALLIGFASNILRQGLDPQEDGLYYVPVALGAAFWSVVVTLLLRRIGCKEPPEG